MWIIILLVAIVVLVKIISAIRSTDNPDKSVSGLVKHDVHGGVIQSAYQRKKYNLQSEAIEAKTRALNAVVGLQTQEHVVEVSRIHSAIARKQARFEEETADEKLNWKHREAKMLHEITLAVGQGAKESKLDPVNYQAVAVAKAQSEIKIDEHEKMKRIDVDAALMEQLNTISAILQYKNIKYNELDEMRNRIFGLIDEEDRIENSNATALVKGQKLALIEGDKRFYMEVLNALKGRLLEAGDGEEISGIEAFSSHIGGLGADSESGSQNQLPVTVTRSGGEQGSN